MKKLFGVVGIIGVCLGLWWLNIPFLRSQVESEPNIVVETPVLAQLVTQLLGPDADVYTIIPPGVNPTEYTLTDQDTRQLASADMIVLNTSDLNGRNMTSFYASDVTVLYIEDFLRSGSLSKGLDATYYWLHPMLWQVVVQWLGASLKKEFSESRSEIDYRMTVYGTNIQTVTHALLRIKKRVPFNMHCITNHPSLLNLTQFLGVQCLVLQDDSLNNEEAVLALYKKIQQYKIQKVFPNAMSDSDALKQFLIEALEQGIVLNSSQPILTLNVENKGSGIYNYETLIEYAAQIVVENF
jgi:ABC-type Zn uptake system ZnuABC Zn-binding protein ZnuA